MERNRERRRPASSSMEEKSGHPRRSFPDEIEAEILLWLPVKTLKRFKCACKTWYSLISSPQFQKDHFRRAQTKPRLLLTLENPENHSAETLLFSAYNHNDDEGTLTLVNNFSKTLPEPYYRPFTLSCLGLVCIVPMFSYSHGVAICNPSTQHLIALPPTQGYSECVGFGFAASTQEFKVVRFFSGEETTSRCQIFTLGTSSWREGRTLPYYVFWGKAPFLHGAIHFLPQISIKYGVNDSDSIAVLDIDTEEYRREIRLPAYYYSLGDCQGRGIMNTMDFVRLALLGGSLCLTFDFGEHECLLELWLLRDYNNAEWVKGYTIDVSVYSYSCYSFQVYLVDTEGDDVFLDCRDAEGVSLLGYNPQDGTVTVKKNKECAATFFMETFYPLRS